MIARLVYSFLFLLSLQSRAIAVSIEQDTSQRGEIWLETFSDVCDQITIFNGSGIVMCGGDSGSIVYQCEVCTEPSFARLLNGPQVTTNVITTTHCFSLLLAGGHEESVTISIRIPPGNAHCPKPAPISITLNMNIPRTFQIAYTPNGCCNIIEL
ncbi:MAG: hypothetical protein JNJ57_06300 [Saprospiraceae bacterium]|nr:hypothetical protein [Saprospiraceae bacterium]